MRIKDEIKTRLAQFSELCEGHQVSKLYAFGSSVTDHFDENTSDIDLLVEVDYPDPVERGEKLMSFWDKLETFSIEKWICLQQLRSKTRF